MAKRVQVVFCIWIILSLNALIIKAKTISNKNDANNLKPANYGILWLNTEASTEDFSKQRDWIISFDNEIADGSHVDIYSINLFPSQSILSYTKERGIDTYTDTLLNLNPYQLNASSYVSSAVIEHTLEEQWYSKVYDSGLANIAVFLVSPGALLQGHIDKLLIKTYVITDKDGTPIDEAFTSLATDKDHVIYQEQLDDMYQLLKQDSQMLCMTDQYYEDKRCNYCSDLACKRAKDGGILCESNSDATRDCTYWKIDVERNESTSETTTKSHSKEETAFGEEATTKSHTFRDTTTVGTTVTMKTKTVLHKDTLIWILVGSLFVVALWILYAFLSMICRRLHNRNPPSVVYIARSVWNSIGSIGSKNSVTNRPAPGTRARPEPSAPSADLVSFDQRSIVSSPSTRPSSSPSESSDTGNDGAVPFRPEPSIIQTDEMPEDSDQDERDNEDNNSDSLSGNEEQSLLADETSDAAAMDGTLRPNDAFVLLTDNEEDTDNTSHFGQTVNGTSEAGQEERLLSENEMSDLISEDGDSSLAALKHKEKDVWTENPFRDIHNGSEETTVKCLDKLSVQATS